MKPLVVYGASLSLCATCEFLDTSSKGLGTEMLFWSYNLQVLSSRNVELMLGYFVANMRRADESSNRIRLELGQPSQRPSRRAPPGQTIEADLVLWTAGTKVSIPPSETQAGYQSFPINGRGQADTDEMLRVRGYPRIFALGDSAGATDGNGKQLPSTAQV